MYEQAFTRRSRLVGILACSVVLCCAVFARAEYAIVELEPYDIGAAHPDQVSLEAAFDQAAVDYGVPAALLRAVAFVESRWVHAGPSIDQGYGIMHLVDNDVARTLTDASALTGYSIEDLKADAIANIRGFAALLARNAADTVGTPAGLEDYWEALKLCSGLHPDVQATQAHEYYRVIVEGAEATNSLGMEIIIEPSKLGGDWTPPIEGQPISILSTDYGPAIWNPADSSNYSTYRGVAIDRWVNHWIGTGTYAGAISWFKNPSSNVSAHFVIRQSDGQLTQMVRIAHKAWHCGNWNSRSIGIEHDAIPSRPWPTSSSAPMLVNSAAACRYFCNLYGIPKTRTYVVGHNEVPGSSTSCPGPLPWTTYMNLVNQSSTPAWAASFNAQSYPSTMEAGSDAIVWAEFKNTGTSAWKHGETYLGTSSPQDRSSPFCTSYNWSGCNRPSDVDQWQVTQNQVGRFTFIITAPSTPGTYTEKYKLVREGVTWFGPEVTWTINVTASKGTLSGKVTNASSGAAISGAAVNLNGVGSTTTNSSGNYTFNNVNAGSYTVSVSATGFNGASSSVSITAGATTTKNFALTPSDTQAPSTPTLTSATATGPTSVQLNWTASTDNVGVTGYQVRRNGATIGSATGTSYTDNTASPLTTYTYEVRARDSVPNYSAWSNSRQVTTPAAPPEPTIVFSDGFNGSVGGWTTGAGAFSYSTAVSHGTYTGAGAARCTANGNSQMYKQFSRPFAQGKVWGWFYDANGGYKTGVCGASHRQGLSLRSGDGAANLYIDNEIYNTPDQSKYYYRILNSGATAGHTIYGTRNPNTNCEGAWIYFETTVNAGAPGSLGSVSLKVTDGAGTSTVSPGMPSDFYNYGIGRVTLGLGVTSATESFWDDIAFQATPPGVPTMNAPSNITASQIRWNFSRADNNLFGYDLANDGGTNVAPVYPSTGWLTRTTTSWTETGLTANTEYSRKVRAWNGTLNSAAYSNTASAYTLSPAPTAGSVTADQTTVCPDTPVTWTAVGGFGPGKVQYYKYAWNTNSTHSFDSSEAVWSSGTLETEAETGGTWYLHVQGFNAEDAANGTFSYAVTVTPTTKVTQAPANAAACLGGNASFTLAAAGSNLVYQWQKDGSDLADGGAYSGVTSPVLTVTGVGPEHVGIYKCVIGGDCGTVDSLEVDLSIKDPVTITSQPLSQLVCPGSTAALQIEAEGAILGYQWQKDGVDIEGATESLLEIAAVSAEDVGSYRCVVRGECGDATSQEAGLTLAQSIGIDFDGDCDVDEADFEQFKICALGPEISQLDPGCAGALLDEDDDVDAADFGIFQRCFSGAGILVDPNCAD